MSLLLLLLLISIQALASKSCYTPSGKLDGNNYYTPCNTSAEHSPCCAYDDVCLTNGYCFSTRAANDSWNLRIERGMCTDWNASGSGCAFWCSDVQPETTVTVDLMQDTLSGGWCCSNDYDNTTQTCGFSTHGRWAPFVLDPAQVIYDRSTGASITNGTISAASTVTAQSSSSDTSTTTIAVAIAVPLGILLLVSVTIIFFLNWKLKRLQQPRGMNELDGRPQQRPFRWSFKPAPVAEAPAIGPMPELGAEEYPQEVGSPMRRVAAA